MSASSKAGPATIALSTPKDWQLLQTHSLAEMFPAMSKLEFHALKEDIRDNGCLKPIVLFEKKILDGRNRHQACVELDKAGELPHPPRFEQFEGNLVAAEREVASLNMTRRHLTKSQKAMILVKAGLISPPAKSGQRRTYGTGRDAIMEVGRRYGVNHVTLYKAAFIASQSPQLIEAVVSGKYSVPVAERMIKEVSASKAGKTAERLKGEEAKLQRSLKQSLFSIRKLADQGRTTREKARNAESTIRAVLKSLGISLDD